VCSQEEIKDIIFQHFGIHKHEFSVTRASSDSFVAFFHEAHDHDTVFVAARVVDCPIVLGFHLCELDFFGTMSCCHTMSRLV
jgi:hypothetical protein